MKKQPVFKQSLKDIQKDWRTITYDYLKKIEECLFSWKQNKEIWLNTFAKYYEFTYNRSNSFQTEIILWLPFKILITFTSSERWT